MFWLYLILGAAWFIVFLVVSVTLGRPEQGCYQPRPSGRPGSPIIPPQPPIATSREGKENEGH